MYYDPERARATGEALDRLLRRSYINRTREVIVNRKLEIVKKFDKPKRDNVEPTS